MFDLEKVCRICGSAGLLPVLDLGRQPPANSLRSDPSEVLADIPLVLVYCGSCRVPQLTATVEPSELFRDYVWVTGTARTTHDYSSVFSDLCIGATVGRSDRAPFVVEVASNDGTFLRRFQDEGWKVLGVDPAENIVSNAVASGVPTRCDFFDRQVADEIRSSCGPADLVLARNVIPHVKAVHSILDGIAHLAGTEGVAAIEFHSAARILQELHYDSIYHEHLFYFSLSTLSALCERHGLHAFDVFDSPISGGSRVLLLSGTQRKKSEPLLAGLAQERADRVDDYETWERFGKAARRHSDELASLIRVRSEFGPIVGYGASARSSTMLNFAGIGVDDVVAVIDQNPAKQGLYTPGTDIPIVARPDGLSMLGDDGAVLLLAWNFATEILDDLRADGVGCDVLIPLPGSIRTV